MDIQVYLQAQIAMLAILSPIAIAIVEVAKRTGLPTRFYPGASLLVGIMLEFLAVAAFKIEQNLFLTLLLGLIIGLMAAGLYSGVKTTFPKDEPV